LLANLTAEAKATTVILTGTSNTVTAAQATTLAGLHNFSLDPEAALTVSDTASNLLLPRNTAGIGAATAIMLTGAGNTATAGQATTLAGLTAFSLASGATLPVGDTASTLLATGNSAGIGIATTITLTGTNNTVSAAQATTLVALQNFSVGIFATLVVSDTA